MTTVLVCDDRAHVRDRLRRSISAVPGVDRVETVESPALAAIRYRDLDPVLVLLGGADRVAVLESLVAEGARVVVLGVPGDREGAVRVMSAGARGYLLDDAAPQELAATVAHALADGRLALPRRERTG